MIAHLQQGALGEARILKPETVKAMHARVFSPHPAVGGSGLGFYETYMNGRRVIGHGGDTNYFHTELGLLEEEGVGFFACVNTGGKAALVPRHFARAFMDHYFPAQLPAVKPPADFAARAGEYAGHYRALRHSYTRFEKVFGLLGGTTVSPTADNTLVIPGLLGDVRAVRRGGAGRRPRAERRPHARVRQGRQGQGRGHGRPVRLHPLLQAALVRRLAFPLRAARVLPPAVRGRRGLGVAALEGPTRPDRSPRAGRAATSAPSPPSTWSSSWPSLPSWRLAWTS